MWVGSDNVIVHHLQEFVRSEKDLLLLQAAIFLLNSKRHLWRVMKRAYIMYYDTA